MQTHEKINLELRDATQLTRLHEDFDHFDGNDDGLMEYEEFVRFLAALQAGMSEDRTPRCAHTCRGEVRAMAQ